MFYLLELDRQWALAQKTN